MGEGRPPLPARVDAETLPPVDPENLVGRSDGTPDGTSHGRPQGTGDVAAALGAILRSACETLCLGRDAEAAGP